ncbi:hypothetical protein B0H15DRAFT_947368 [Mycena belliarum]|uniref:Uncharacterized protein n=1 Tax=Mycena belliarum TaxID=1033014 RepID=A0AAD6U9G1_9AGAR|nr:hypothetical protein B0H15DRAFT_947368 [Mycena belliae]
MNERPNALYTFDTIKQCIFSHTTYRSLISKTNLHVDSQETPMVLVDTFLLLVAAIHASIDMAAFTVWFLGVFEPLIRVSEVLL